jgi:hypothetical protein
MSTDKPTTRKPTTPKATTRRPATRKPAAAKTVHAESASPVDVTVEVTVDEAAVADRVRKPLYASVGVADLAVERVRAARSTVEASAQTATRTVRTLPQTLPILVRGRLEALPQRINVVSGTYAGLAERGSKVVSSVRGSAGTSIAVEQAKTARAQVKGAATSVRKAAGAAEKVAGSLLSRLG